MERQSQERCRCLVNVGGVFLTFDVAAGRKMETVMVVTHLISSHTFGRSGAQPVIDFGILVLVPFLFVVSLLVLCVFLSVLVGDVWGRAWFLLFGTPFPQQK